MHFFAAARPACIHIEVSVHVVDDPKGWRPDIFVSYSEHGKSVLKNLPMNQTFATPAEAEKTGSNFCGFSTLDKSTAQAQQMKEGALRVL